MKILYPLFISSMVTITGCNSKNNTSEINKSETEAKQKIITFTDFKKVKGVDNVLNVPFELFTKLDSVQFFVSPSKDAPRLKVAYNKLDNYYGFEEFDDFYSIHYSINNNISNSIEAFVLKSEFTPASELTLKGMDLYEIRSSKLKGNVDLKNKSFNAYGTITEVSEQEFKTASKNRIDEVFVKNPSVKLKDDNWIFTGNGKETIITQHENVSTEDGVLSNEYIGKSPSLNLEIFKENSAEVLDTYYTFYNVKSTTDFALFTGGFPHILPGKNWISYIGSNDDVGSNFEISKYPGQGSGQESLFYVNFTTFKIAEETKAFWADQETFYAEVYPVNSAASKGKKQKTAFIKIKLKPNLF
ncbi:resolvase [Chryseobacterium artocarpi]|uniref:resolvase n=1 Tax=Chryseobacterium artocarpi TaxID=1414727 RepID=UPI003F34D98F